MSKVASKRALPAWLHPAGWFWWHWVALLGTLVYLVTTYFVIPVDVAEFMGRVQVDEANALYLRAGIGGFALYVGFVIRGHPWWHLIICLLIAVFTSGQIMRTIYTGEVSGVPTSFLVMYVGWAIYLIALAVRPSVYEQLDDERRRTEACSDRADQAEERVAELEAQLGLRRRKP
ncbi:hypothetical protein [Deinococcus sp. Leaf326]|uniref:hypothetical protein n=1 Tax=Deinococcus sp. Leaf326 TaxID=1736338 RepID=UPI000B33F436|nr:hypothetical protein [Deinococcus sp. Leaf326]